MLARCSPERLHRRLHLLARTSTWHRPTARQRVYALYTPLLGVTLGWRVLLLGIGVVALGEEDAAATRSPSRTGTIGASAEVEQQTARRAGARPGDETGIKRRGAAQGGPAAGRPAGSGAAAPLVAAGRRPDQEAVATTADSARPPGERPGTDVRQPKVRMVHARRHAGPPRGPERRRSDDGLPGHPERARTRRRLARAADAAPRPGRAHRLTPGPPGPAPARASTTATTSPTRRSARTPAARRPVRAADQPAALPVPPVAVPRHRARQAGLRSGHAAAAEAADRASTTRATSWRPVTSPSRRPGFWERPIMSVDTSQGHRQSRPRRQGLADRRWTSSTSRFQRGHARCARAEQGLPGPLVVPARRDRALLVHRPAADRHVS